MTKRRSRQQATEPWHPTSLPVNPAHFVCGIGAGRRKNPLKDRSGPGIASAHHDSKPLSPLSGIRLSACLRSRCVRARITRVLKTDRIQELQARSHGDYIVVLKNGVEVPLSRGYRGNLEGWLRHSSFAVSQEWRRALFASFCKASSCYSYRHGIWYLLTEHPYWATAA